ncbi:MAG: cupin domain-containing protein [Candidatus Gygaella obscura]|nr:cupin domain-containing protein [Candidatus Gygaella obscura]
MEIKVERLSNEELQKRQVFEWSIWNKEASVFDWHYDQQEQCYFLEGKVTVKTKDGESVSFTKGDFVTFPKGLSCTWQIEEDVKKHYNFS